MKLHQPTNHNLFIESIEQTAVEFNVPGSYVEKDYYLTLALLNLSKFEDSDHVIFKGGTSLAKVYKAIYRFSEDIDLAILPGKDWSNAKITRVMKKAIAQASRGLTDAGETFKNGSKFRKKSYVFSSVMPKENKGEVKDALLLECNAYTTPSPVEKKPIRSLIAEWALRQDHTAFIEQFQLHDVTVSVLSWQRTFCEKIQALMAAASRGELGDKVRHFYDLTLLCRCDEINHFLHTDNEFFPMMALVIQNDISHAGNIVYPWITPALNENPPFCNFEQAWAIVEAAYNGSFQMMITRPDKSPTAAEIATAFRLIYERLTAYSDSSNHLNCLTMIAGN